MIILAGPGWALLTAAVVLMVCSLDTKKILSNARVAVRNRFAAAIALMSGAFVIGPVGVWLVAGLGAAFVTLGILSGGLSLMVGWNVGK